MFLLLFNWAKARDDQQGGKSLAKCLCELRVVPFNFVVVDAFVLLERGRAPPGTACSCLYSGCCVQLARMLT